MYMRIKKLRSFSLVSHPYFSFFVLFGFVCFSSGKIKYFAKQMIELFLQHTFGTESMKQTFSDENQNCR